MALCSSMAGLSLGFSASVGRVESLRAQPQPHASTAARIAPTCEVRVRGSACWARRSSGWHQRRRPSLTRRLQIRFTRLGRNKSPFYRVVVMDSRTRRDGRPLEVRPGCSRTRVSLPP